MLTTYAVLFLRTEAGKGEIRAQSVKLSRPARNLLLLMDASCTGQEWIDRVHGSSSADLDMLLYNGLIAQKIVTDAGSGHLQVPVEDAVRNWTYDALYALLTSEAKERFGLIKGFRLILTIEGCSDADGLQRVALDFAKQIRHEHGEEAAARFRKQLGATK